MSHAANSPATLTVAGAMKRLRRSQYAIWSWQNRGWLKPISKRRPRRFTVDAVDEAAKIAAEHRRKQKLESLAKARIARVGNEARGLSRQQAADRAGVKPATIDKWRRRPDFPLAAIPGTNPFRYEPEAVDAAAEFAADHLREVRRSTMLANRSTDPKVRWPDPEPGTVTAEMAANRLGVRASTIRNRKNAGDLRPISERPRLCFAAKLVDESALAMVGNGDVPLIELPKRIPGSGGPDKLNQIRRVAGKIAGEEPGFLYRRRGPELARPGRRATKRPLLCVREERVAEILRRVFELRRLPAETISIATEEAPAKPKHAGGRRKGTGKLEYVRTWLETPEAREIIRTASRKWVNHRLADACNAAHPNRERITHVQMKNVRRPTV